MLMDSYAGVLGRPIEIGLDRVLNAPDVTPLQRSVAAHMLERVQLREQIASAESMQAFIDFEAAFHSTCESSATTASP